MLLKLLAAKLDSKTNQIKSNTEQKDNALKKIYILNRNSKEDLNCTCKYMTAKEGK